jgi:hypothetical protein
MNDKISATFDEVDAINAKNKKVFSDTSFLIIDNIENKKGKAKTTTIQVEERNGMKISVRATRLTNDKPHSAIKIKLENSVVNKDVAEELGNRLDNKEINSEDVKNFLRTSVIHELKGLPSGVQKEASNKIFQQRQNQNFINSGTVSVLLLNSGMVNRPIVRNWYKAILVLIEMLMYLANINQSVADELKKDEKRTLDESTERLTQRLNQLRLLLHE